MTRFLDINQGVKIIGKFVESIQIAHSPLREVKISSLQVLLMPTLDKKSRYYYIKIFSCAWMKKQRLYIKYILVVFDTIMERFDNNNEGLIEKCKRRNSVHQEFSFIGKSIEEAPAGISIWCLMYRLNETNSYDAWWWGSDELEI